jgi:hypothetical protein
LKQAIKSWLQKNKLGARLFATLVFGAFVYLGINGVSDSVSILVNPISSMTLLPISADAAKFRAVILLALNLAILVGSLAMLLGIWQRGGSRKGYIVVAVVYAGMGLYQIVSAVVQFNRPQLAIPGIVYLLLGAAAYSLGRQLSGAKPAAKSAGR